MVVRCHPRLPLVVTASRDRSFKVRFHCCLLPVQMTDNIATLCCAAQLWELTEVLAVPSASGAVPPAAHDAAADGDGAAKSLVWKCRSVGYYKDFPVSIVVAATVL